MKDIKDYSSKTLKGRNLAWLVATLVLDVLVLLVIAFHTAIDDLTPTRLAVIRASLTALLPIPVLILSSLISSDHKAILVFWRLKHPLPGARAFSVHAPADHRIDLVKLKKNVGSSPSLKGIRIRSGTGSTKKSIQIHPSWTATRSIFCSATLRQCRCFLCRRCPWYSTSAASIQRACWSPQLGSWGSI